MVINGALMVINGDLPSGKPGVFWWMINIYDFMGILMGHNGILWNFNGI